MVLWRRFGSAGLEGLICRRKKGYSLPGGGVPSVGGDVRLRGFRVLDSGGGSMFCYTHFRNYMTSGLAKPRPEAEGKGGDWRKPKVENDGGIRINEAINEREVRLVTDQGHRIISIQEALSLARKLDLDLVEVQRKIKVEGGAQSPVFKPAVCKLLDYCKEKYKQDVKEKERAKSKAAIALRNGENKEVRFKAKTELKDLKIKAESVKRLMERGYRVKCTAMSTGKDDEHMGGLLLNLLSLIEEISVVESGPHLDTKNAYVIVKHIKFASKKGKKVSKAMETVSSVLSAHSKVAADSNSASKDEDDFHAGEEEEEEEWEAVESDSETEIDAASIQAKSNAQNPSGSRPTSPPKVVSHGFGSVTDWSGSKATDDTKHTSSSGTESNSEPSITNASGKNSPGFHPSPPEPYVAETNRYTKGSNSAFHRIRPTNRDPSFIGKAANGNQERIPEPSNRREIEGRGQSNRNDRTAHTFHPNSSSPRHGVLGGSESSGSNDRSKVGGATMGNPNSTNVSQQRFGVFSPTKSSPPVDERQMREISRGRVNNSSSPTSNYGIFSTPKKTSSDDQMKLRDETRGKSVRVAPGSADTSESSDRSPPSPRFGIFTASKKTNSGDGRVGD